MAASRPSETSLALVKMRMSGITPASGFGLGVSVLMDLGRSAALGSVGNYGWSGAANTHFWVDPQEQLVGLLMLQYMPSDTYPVVADFRNQVYQALVG